MCQLWTINTDCVKEPNLRSKPDLDCLYRFGTMLSSQTCVCCVTVILLLRHFKSSGSLPKHQCYSCLHKVLSMHSLSKITSSLRSVHQSTGSLLTCCSSKVCSCPSKQLLLVVSIIIWSLSSWLLKQYCQASNHCHVSQFQSLAHVTISTTAFNLSLTGSYLHVTLPYLTCFQAHHSGFS